MTEKRQPVDFSTKVLRVAVPGTAFGAGTLSFSMIETIQHFERKREMKEEYEDTNPMPYTDTQYRDATSLVIETNRTIDALQVEGNIAKISQVVGGSNVQNAGQIMREQQEYYTARTEHVSAALEEAEPFGVNKDIINIMGIDIGFMITTVSAFAAIAAGIGKFRKRPRRPIQ